MNESCEPRWAHALHAQGKTNTEPAREAFFARFERQVDPEGILSDSERLKRAEHARNQYLQGLAFRSAVARRRARRDKWEGSPAL